MTTKKTLDWAAADSAPNIGQVIVDSNNKKWKITDKIVRTWSIEMIEIEAD